MNSPQIFKVKELNLDIIQPNSNTMNNLDQGGMKTVVVGKPGCFARGTKVLMYDGTVKCIEDVIVGDQVMGDDSEPRNVLELCNSRDTMYSITPNKGDQVIVNRNHILSLKCTGYNQHEKGEILDIPLNEYLEKSPTFQQRYKWYRTGVEFQENKVDLDAYLLGYWIGDGSSYGAMITTVDEEVLEYFDRKLSDLGLFLKQKPQDPITYRIIQTDGPKHFKNKFLNFLRDNNLIKNKHIPTSYLVNSRTVRLELLAGILDSDGSYDVRGNCFDIIQKNERVLDDVVFLARSLGFSAYKKECTKRCVNSEGHIGVYYRCCISGNVSEIPCHIARKQPSERKQVKDVLVTGFTVDELEEDEYFGFVLDGNHRFLLSDFSVVHNTGKTTLITSLLYAKKHIFPVGIAMSGSEDSNGSYRKIMPSTFVFNDYNEDKIKDFIRRQKIAREHLANPWGVILLDDCTDDPRIFNKPLQHGMYKRGRHWKMWYILSLQYAMDVKPVIRTNVDGIFILREPILKNRESLWRNYASIIPDFSMFCDVMDQLTDDYTALYINNAGKSNNWQDCVFYYKASLTPENFKFGCDDYWKFHYDRYEKNYVESF